MAISPTNKLVWLVKTIHQAGRITFKEIQMKWRDNEEMSGGVELPRRTFNNWIFAIWDMFGLDIQCEKCGDFPYYIANEEDMRNGSIENWLLNSYSVTNSLVSNRAIKDKILLEEVPSGLNYLDDIIDAIRRCRMIHIDYRRYGETEIKSHYLMPCVSGFSVSVGIWSEGFGLMASLVSSALTGLLGLGCRAILLIIQRISLLMSISKDLTVLLWLMTWPWRR